MVCQSKAFLSSGNYRNPSQCFTYFREIW